MFLTENCQASSAISNSLGRGMYGMLPKCRARLEANESVFISVSLIKSRKGKFSRERLNDPESECRWNWMELDLSAIQAIPDLQPRVA